MAFSETYLSRSKVLYVYILKCSDDSYYTGLTNNIELRVAQHNSGTVTDSYTCHRKPVKLVYCEMFTEYLKAIEWEKRIKGWTRRKKEALINGEWDKLKEFSKCMNDTSAIPRLTTAPFDSAQGDTHSSSI